MTDPAAGDPFEGPADAPNRTDNDAVRRGRGAYRAGSRPEPAPNIPQGPPLHRQSPLRIGFLFTVGALLALLLAQTAVLAQSVLIIILLAFFVALGLTPLVATIERLGLPRWLAVALVVLTGLGLLALAVWAIAPVFTKQITTLIEQGPALLTSLRDNPELRSLDDRFGVITKASEFLASGEIATQAFGGVLGAGQVLVSTLVSVITMTVLTLYFLATMPSIKRAIYRLSPASRRERLRYLADEIFERVGAYLSGLFVIVTLAGTGTMIFLLIIGLGEYALALAVVVALFDFIPLVGPTIGLVIVTTICFISSPQQGIAALIYYIVYTQFEAYFIYPRVMSRSVSVPGVVTITAALLGGTLLGIVGALIAIPTAAIILLLLREVIQPRLDST
ncbi:AI-2E family transporter [Propionibacteriaceae bacterium Y1700]|uniref:AI-2E family transporter n=1 Tax=Microlunatus sp. Y1700 TaxID=3418487 RepID=UPI003DA7796A